MMIEAVLQWAFILLLIYFPVRAWLRGEVRPDRRLAKDLGLPPANPFTIARHGRSFTVRVTSGSKGAPPTMRLTASVDEGDEAADGCYRGSARGHLDVRPALSIRAEGMLDGLGVRLGLARRIDAGGALGDKWIETRSPEEDVRKTLEAPGLAEAIRGLLTEADRVELDPAGLSMEVKGPADVPSFERRAAALAQAAAALPLFTVGRAARPASTLALTMPLLGSMLAAPVLIAVALAFEPVDPLATQHAHLLAAAAWLLAQTAAFLVVRAGKGGVGRFIYRAFTALFVVPAGTVALLFWANAALDRSPSERHETEITRVWTSSTRRSITHHLDLASWRYERIVTVDVPASIAQKAKVGARVVVTTRAGRLGWEWVKGVEIAPR